MKYANTKGGQKIAKNDVNINGKLFSIWLNKGYANPLCVSEFRLRKFLPKVKL